MLNQLGHKTAFIGKVGEDIFGRCLKRVLDEVGIGKEQFDYGIRYCDVLKISDNEIQWFTGEEDYDKGVQML